MLDADFYERLAKELDSENFHKKYKRGPYGNRERFGVDITDYSSWKTSGRKSKTHMHEENYNSLLSNGGGSISLFFDLLLENKEELYRTLYGKLRTEKMQDDYFFHMSMVKDSVGYAVEAHTDNEENIFTILFYAPKTDINKEFGLHVYKDAAKNGAKLLDFMPNRMVVFAPCEENKDRPPTWHEVRRLSNKLVGTRNSFQMFFYKNESGE